MVRNQWPSTSLDQPARLPRQTSRMNAAPEVSIVVPAYNEERRLPRTLERISAYLASDGLDAEVIVVDDGSDDRTSQIVDEWRGRLPALRLLSNGRNRGKGYSVRRGILEARGRLVLFTDADLSVPIQEVDNLLTALGTYDVVVASRALDRSLIAVPPPRLRELAGKVYNQLTRWITGLNFTDTQCGFKGFVRERARLVFEQQRIERWGFDPEILFIARRQGLRAVEVPVRSAHDPDTKLRIFRDSLCMLADLLRIRWNSLLNRYTERRL